MELTSLLPNYKKQGNEWEAVAREYYEMLTIKKLYEKKAKELHNKLLTLSDNQDSYSDTFIFSCTISKGAISYKDIPILKIIDLEPYRGPEIKRWTLKKL